MKKTKPGIKYRRGDLILLPFPFTDLSSIKKRPALIISPDWYNDKFEDVIVLAVTSQIPKQTGTLEVLVEEHDLDSGVLPKASIVKISKIFACHQLLVIKQVCHLR